MFWKVNIKGNQTKITLFQAISQIKDNYRITFRVTLLKIKNNYN